MDVGIARTTCGSEALDERDDTDYTCIVCVDDTAAPEVGERGRLGGLPSARQLHCAAVRGLNDRRSIRL